MYVLKSEGRKRGMLSKNQDLTVGNVSDINGLELIIRGFSNTQTPKVHTILNVIHLNSKHRRSKPKKC